MNMDHEKMLDEILENYFRHKQLEEFQRILKEVIEEVDTRSERN